MKRSISQKQVIQVFFLAVLLFASACNSVNSDNNSEADNKVSIVEEQKEQDTLEIINGTFLGNEQRNYYGDSIGNDLTEVWKLYLGEGTTNLAKGQVVWKGAGWTGQPLMVREFDQKYLLLGCYDHNLKKINAATGELIWSYAYDDVIKGTGSIWHNKKAASPEEQLIVLQGSRLGIQNSLAAPEVYSYRAISYASGNELWRMNSKRSGSYSRDVDASAITIGDTAYLGLENGYFISFNPGRESAKPIASTEYYEPDIFQELPLFEKEDIWKHGGNLVTEASPAKIGDHIYIASGSGHVYGYNLRSKSIDWTFDIGSDLDGSPVVTSDGCLLVSIEKQYISGKGGVFKLDPSKRPEDCVVWYFSTGNREFADWKGGVVGSVAINDSYNAQGKYPYMAVFSGIDGTMYIVDHKSVDPVETSVGPNEKNTYPMPALLDRRKIGPSISTPIFVQDKIVAAGYSGLNLFKVNSNGKIVSETKKNGVFEASPVADRGRIYIASRNGYLYCLGGDAQKEAKIDKNKTMPSKTVKKVEAKKKTEKALINNNKPVHRPSNVSSHGKKLVSNNYYLVAGAFGVRSNAEGELKRLQAKGIDAFVAERPNNLNYVIVGVGSNEIEIKKIKVALEEKFLIDAWVYRCP